VLVLASPTVDARSGGMCTAIAGSSIAYVVFNRKSFQWIWVAGSRSMGILLIAGMASIDAARAGGPMSHWERAILVSCFSPP
jgi:hypothetical protein